jgi:hypothetical protein
MGCRGGYFQITFTAKDKRKNAIPRVEELTKIIATKFGMRQFSAVIECIDIGVAADRVGDVLPATIGPALTAFGHEVDALVLDQDDATLIDHRFGQYEPQVGAAEMNGHGLISLK